MGNLRTDTHDGFSVTPPWQYYSSERQQSAPERISRGENIERNITSARGITRPIEIRERYPEANNLGDGQSRLYCDHLDLEQNRNITKPRTSPTNICWGECSDTISQGEFCRTEQPSRE